MSTMREAFLGMTLPADKVATPVGKVLLKVAERQDKICRNKQQKKWDARLAYRTAQQLKKEGVI